MSSKYPNEPITNNIDYISDKLTTNHNHNHNHNH